MAALVRPQHQMVIPKKAKVALEQGLFINGISGIVTGSWYEGVINRKLWK